ncbi:MAG TPA: chorismate mutase [Stellaceae bacterium]|jgi:chorismate mutase|nr:chorismate mutase [Stellaceae bacterium]
MADRPRSLKTLRQEIDRIDAQLHDLVMRRAVAVGEVAAVKRADGMPAEVPTREAEILRNLLKRHSGRFPATSLVRLWREMVGAAISMQTEFSVAVVTTEADPGIWDLARDHYGAAVPMTACHNSTEVMRALAENRASVGVVPVPGDGVEDAWWRTLASAGPGPRVTARLPFGGRGNARGSRDAFVLSQASVEPEKSERSLYAIEVAGEVSRGGLSTMLSNAGLPATLLAMARVGGGATAGLIEIDEGVAPEDARLQNLTPPGGETHARASALGFYARPLSAQELGPKEPARTSASP